MAFSLLFIGLFIGVVFSVLTPLNLLNKNERNFESILESSLLGFLMGLFWFITIPVIVGYLYLKDIKDKHI